MSADDPIFDHAPRRRAGKAPSPAAPTDGELGPAARRSPPSLRLPKIESAPFLVLLICASASASLVIAEVMARRGAVRGDAGAPAAATAAPVIGVVQLPASSAATPEDLCRRYGLSRTCDEALRCAGAVTRNSDGARVVRLVLRRGREICAGITDARP